MFYSTLQSITLLAATPSTIPWSLNVAIVMVACNLVAIAIGRFAIQNAGQSMPIPFKGPFDRFGIPELLATTSFGHILGAGMILGLSNAGIL